MKNKRKNWADYDLLFSIHIWRSLNYKIYKTERICWLSYDYNLK